VGYRKPQTHYRLKFADEDMAGLEITSRAPTIAELLDIGPMADVIDQRQPDLPQLRSLLERFCGLLVSWNLEDEQGTELPMTADALLQFELPFLMKVLNAWAGAVTSVAPPLPSGSGSGPASPAGLQIPVEPMTESPGS
jgi:hypothetical protein